MIIKKYACAFLAAITLVTLVSCRETEHWKDDGDSRASDSEIGVEPRALESVLDGIYKTVAPKFDIRTIKVNVQDKDMLRYYTGIEDCGDVEEAVVSEAASEDIAYSLAIVKVKPSADAGKLAEKMKSSVDTARFIGQRIDTKETVAVGDTVLLLIMDSRFDGELASGSIIEAFRNLAK